MPTRDEQTTRGRPRTPTAGARGRPGPVPGHPPFPLRGALRSVALPLLLAALLEGGFLQQVGPPVSPVSSGAPVDAAAQHDSWESVPAPPSQELEVVGTIQATLDGKERAWYLVAGDPEGPLGSNAVWQVFEPSEGTRLANLAGLDTPDVPAELLARDVDPVEALAGADYSGSVLTVMFEFGPEDSSVRQELPDPDGLGGVMYLSDASRIGDPAVTYFLADGAVHVTRIEARRSGDSQFEGSFHGTLRTRTGERSIELTEGRFEVEGARYVQVEE